VKNEWIVICFDCLFVYRKSVTPYWFCVWSEVVAIMLDNDNCSQELLMTAEEVRQRLSKYGASSEPPRDDAVVHPTDDRYKFFERVGFSPKNNEIFI
jgi:hypothetical protein